MSNIFYGLCGEGYGHASRALALIENMPEHNFYIYTYGKAIDFIKLNNLPNIKQRVNVGGLKLVEKNGKVSTLGTIFSAGEFLLKDYSESMKFIANDANFFGADLFLTDWEPLIPRVARRLDIPCISIDNQHFSRFSNYKMRGRLGVYDFLMRMLTHIMIPTANHYIISSFQQPLVNQSSNVSAANVFVKRAMCNIDTRHMHHILIYSSYREITERLLSNIEQVSKIPVIVYGPEPARKFTNVTFKKIGLPDFAYDLSSSVAVFSTAGIQLMGEAAYFGKPCFVVPLPNQYEQDINGECLEEVGLGVSCKFNDINPDKIKMFLNVYKNGVRPRPNGVEEAINIINTYL